MKRKYLNFISFCWLLACVPALANSLYSRLGVGLVHLRAGAKAIGMGNASLAIADGLAAYQLNPATLASVQFARLQTAFSIESANVKLNDSSGRFRNANFSGVSLMLPVTKGHVVALGIEPYSRVDFSLNQFGSDSNGDYEQIYNGSGGIDEAYLAFAGTIGGAGSSSGLRYGIAADFYFGRIQRNWRVNFSNGSLISTEDEIGAYFHGIGFHAGVQWYHPRWQVGVAARPAVDLDVETKGEYIFGATSEVVKKKANLPLWFGVGIGYRPDSKWQLAADYRLQRWGEVSADRSLNTVLGNSHEFGTGFEFTASKNPLDSYVKRISYRAGVSFARLPYQDPVGESISERLVTAGVGLPFRFGSSRIDVAFEYGKRGALDSNPAEESIFRVSFSISGAERWFVRNRP